MAPDAAPLIAAYEAGGFSMAAVASAQHHMVRGSEVVAADSGLLAAAIVAGYARRDWRRTVLCHTPGCGASAAREIATTAAKEFRLATPSADRSAFSLGRGCAEGASGGA